MRIILKIEGGFLIYCLFSFTIGNAQDILWIRTYDCEGLMDMAYGVATDRDGNVIVTGYSEVGKGNYNYHTIKYNADGDILWSRTYDGGGIDRAYGVATDRDGNIIVTGDSDSCGGGPPYCYGYYTIKYSPNGDILWTRYANPGPAYGVATDKDDNIIVTGISGDSVTHTSGYCTIKYSPDGDILWRRTHYGASGEARSVATDAEGNIIVTGASFLTIKYTPDGDTIWTRVYDSGDDDHAYGVATDKEGNIIVVGDSYRYDYYTIKYNPDGNVLWTRRYDGGGKDFAYGVTTDTAGNVIVTGMSWLGTSYDYYTIKYSPDGELLWVGFYDKGADAAKGVATDLEGNIIVTGNSWKSPRDSYYCTIKYSGSSGIEEWDSGEAISKYLMVYQNPFIKSTIISYSLPTSSWVTLRVYDSSGKKIVTLVNKRKEKGDYVMMWDGKDRYGKSVSSGVYFFELATDSGFKIIRKAVLLKERR